MKKLFLVLSLLGVAYGQIINERIDGTVSHKVFQAYTKSSYTQATANETTAFIPYGGAQRLSVFAQATDTIKAVVKYQFKHSMTGYLTGWTATADSVSLIGTAASPNSDRIHAFASSDTSTSGYDQIRFYIDYVTYLGVNYTGGTIKLFLDMYKP